MKSVNENGDENGLRVEASRSSTVRVAAPVSRNGQENGGEGSERLLTPCGKEDWARKPDVGFDRTDLLTRREI